MLLHCNVKKITCICTYRWWPLWLDDTYVHSRHTLKTYHYHFCLNSLMTFWWQIHRYSPNCQISLNNLNIRNSITGREREVAGRQTEWSDDHHISYTFIYIYIICPIDDFEIMKIIFYFKYLMHVVYLLASWFSMFTIRNFLLCVPFNFYFHVFFLFGL